MYNKYIIIVNSITIVLRDRVVDVVFFFFFFFLMPLTWLFQIKFVSYLIKSVDYIQIK